VLTGRACFHGLCEGQLTWQICRDDSSSTFGHQRKKHVHHLCLNVYMHVPVARSTSPEEKSFPRPKAGYAMQGKTKNTRVVLQRSVHQPTPSDQVPEAVLVICTAPEFTLWMQEPLLLVTVITFPPKSRITPENPQRLVGLDPESGPLYSRFLYACCCHGHICQPFLKRHVS
jgi:hypothetical protein